MSGRRDIGAETWRPSRLKGSGGGEHGNLSQSDLLFGTFSHFSTPTPPLVTQLERLQLTKMTAEKIDIRAAGFADIPVLSDLIRVSFGDVAERFALTLENCPKHPSNCTDEWIEKDFARGVTYYILEHGGAPVGCVALEKANPDLWYLERLGVLPQSRRKAFGKALVDHVFSEARALGAKKISIGIISDDAELKLWYKKIGFLERETKEFAHLPFLVTFMEYEL